MTGYEANKRWRTTHTQLRHEGKTRNYDQVAGPQHRSRDPWTQEEEAAVLAHEAPDRELAVKIGRSVRAIQIRRSRLQPATPLAAQGGDDAR